MRIRINFKSDFCNVPSCDICFKNGADTTAAEALNADKLTEALAKIKCPKCTGAMVIRTNSSTQQKFLGCKIFPNCRGTRPLPFELNKLITAVAVTPTPVETPVVATLNKEQPKVKWVNPFEKPKQEVTFDSLLARPIQLSDEQAKFEGELSMFANAQRQIELKKGEV